MDNVRKVSHSSIGQTWKCLAYDVTVSDTMAKSHVEAVSNLAVTNVAADKVAANKKTKSKGAPANTHFYSSIR